MLWTLAFINYFPICLQVVSFSAYIGFGYNIDLSVAYTVITIFQMIDSPIRLLPFFLGQFIEF